MDVAVTSRRDCEDAADSLMIRDASFTKPARLRPEGTRQGLCAVSRRTISPISS